MMFLQISDLNLIFYKVGIAFSVLYFWPDFCNNIVIMNVYVVK